MSIQAKSLQAVILLSIPVTVSLSWVLGGELVKAIPPVSLSIGRLALGVLVFFLFSSITRDLKDLPTPEKMRWWGQQALLAATGRSAYYALTATSLVSISPLEALIITTLMPVFTLALQRLIGVRFSSPGVPTFGLLATAATVAAIVLKSGLSESGISTLHMGRLLMMAGIAAYVVHLVLYARFVKDKNPANPLFAQFLFGFLMLLPFEPHGLGFMSHLTAVSWFQFLVYALVCNIVPFVAAHYALQTFGPFIVSTVASTSPFFGTLFAMALGVPTPSFWFFAFGTLAAGFVFFCLRSNMGRTRSRILKDCTRSSEAT